jgi:hypothetical protein
MSEDERNPERHASRGVDEAGALSEVAADLGELVAAHPVGAMATALGVGYLVGGGVFTRLTSRLLRLALRLGVQFAVLPVLEQELATLAGGVKTPRTNPERAEKAH